MAELIGKAVGQAVNGIVDVVDVDGVVRRVDVDDAIQRIDMNDLLDKVDMNRLIDRVDLNRQLDRVDLDRALRRVDVNALVLRSNVGAILTHSTTGIFSDILDTIRASVVHADIWIYIGMSFLLRRDVNVLPPVPGETNERKKPATEMALSTSVQGCLNGVVSKGLSVLVDSFLVTFSFALLLIVVEMGWKVLTDGDNRPQIDRDSRYALVSYCGGRSDGTKYYRHPGVHPNGPLAPFGRGGHDPRRGGIVASRWAHVARCRGGHRLGL
eukprot:scaffold17510_cov184-Amphora_coffeaeformis.AAC.1